jgi:predicted thioesterase
MSLRREPKVKTATFTSQSRHHQLVPYGRNPDPVEKSPFPNVLSTSQIVEFVDRASAKLFEEFDQQQCEALVTVRVNVNHLRPCLSGPSLTAVATFVGWDEQEGDKPPVIRVACTVSDSVDGPAGIIARADAWFSLACRINLESAACLRLDNYWTLTHTLSEARQSWTTGHHRPSGLDHAIKHGDNDLVRHWLKKARPALDADHLSSGLQLAKQCGNAFAVKLILHKYKIDKKSVLLKDAVKCGQLATV